MQLWLQQEQKISKRKADVLRKSSLGELSTEDLRDLRAGKKKEARPTCVSPGPNDGDLAALDAGRSERREAKIRDREEKNRLKKKEKLALEAKKLEIDVVEKERGFKLQEQNMKMQAEYFSFSRSSFRVANRMGTTTGVLAMKQGMSRA